MIRLSAIIILTVCLISCANSQNQNKDNFRLVGGPCEGCEAIFEYDDMDLLPVDTLPDYNDEGPKIKVTGTVYQNDGRTPAEGVILYIYHTNQDGIYASKDGATGWAKHHGYIRGWVQSDRNGHYEFYTLRPGVYPSRSEPAHIHLTVLEPSGKYYWLESYHFKGDSLLTNRELNLKAPRGGSGSLLYLTQEQSNLVGTRDIILGRNIPGYDQ